MSFSKLSYSRATSSITPRRRSRPKRIDFKSIVTAAMPFLPNIVQRWLPEGKACGSEWLARNPRRKDMNIGSFSINVSNGRWSDFASGDAGGDIIALGAYLYGISQAEAARRVASMIGMGSAS